ncbi:hypothetical protein ASG69_04985 [Rhodococcus sp. Leaf225]|nr:hypothetical protein ASG69_04985 [Rhodococcus sp. Leaf225]KQU44691.1 hypothetical protein ASH03_12155 [Rhodococcus sp. Leaf258]
MFSSGSRARTSTVEVPDRASSVEWHAATRESWFVRGIGRSDEKAGSHCVRSSTGTVGDCHRTAWADRDPST